MKHQTPKTKELQDAVIAKVKQRLDAAKSGQKVDLVKLKKQLIASITANNEKKTIKILGDIQKSVSNKDLVTVMKEVKASVEANKFTFPKYIEIIQTARPKWYKDPVETVKINGPVELKNAVKIEGTVKTEADAGTWTALAAVLGVVMEGLFSFLNKFSQKVFRVMPSKEHYTTPQLVVLADSKTGRPVDLKDIGSSHDGKVVVVGQGSRGGQQGGGSSVENVGIKDATGDRINPATEENIDTLNSAIAALKETSENDDIFMRQLLQLLRPLSIVTNGSYRLSIDVNSGTIGTVTAVTTVSTVTAVTTVSTVTTVGTVSNQTNMGGLNAFDLQVNTARSAFALGNRANVSF